MTSPFDYDGIDWMNDPLFQVPNPAFVRRRLRTRLIASAITILTAIVCLYGIYHSI